MLIISVIVQALVLVRASEHTYFVKPNNVSTSCQSYMSPCLTLDEYASNQSEFFTSNSTFLFLPGAHTTKTVVLLVNVSNIVLRGNDSNPESYLTDWSIECKSVVNLVLQGLTLTYTGGIHDDVVTSSDSSTFITGAVFQVSTLFQAKMKPFNFRFDCFFDEGNMSGNILTLTNSSTSIIHTIFQGSTQLKIRAIYSNHSNAALEHCLFKQNTAFPFGGALLLCRSIFVISDSVFTENSARNVGGAMIVFNSELNVSKSTFVSNSAPEAGGIGCSECSLFTSSVHFINNSANHHLKGGAVVVKNAKAVFSNTTVTHNSGTALRFFRSSIQFTGQSYFKENVNMMSASGAIEADMSNVSFSGVTCFEDNYALVDGGAISGIKKIKLLFSGDTKFINNTSNEGVGGAVGIAIHSRLEMHGSVLFENNNCIYSYGGAVGAYDSSEIEIFDSVIFRRNSAVKGGAIYLRGSLLFLNHDTETQFIENFAKSLGGGMFVADQIDYYQCNFSIQTQYSGFDVVYNLPDCFLELVKYSFWYPPKYKILSINDTAGEDGQFLYGGLMDKCHVIDYVFKWQSQTHLLYNILFNNILNIQMNNSTSPISNAISSEAYILCFCESDENYDCIGMKQISTLRGRRFSVSVLAFSQGNTTTAATILAKVSETARLRINQNSQQIRTNCSTLSYNMYSNGNTEQLVLYPDAQCRDTGLARAVVNVTFETCPHGFVVSDGECVCERRLLKYTNQCVIGDYNNYIIGSRVWIGYSNDITLGVGLILCSSCPADYCKTDEVNISFTDLDIQCAYNHSGLLCGSCAENHSLTFGDIGCRKCSNTFLLLLLAFAGAGILLVAFLSILRLTVATGMINSIILYANIVQANKLVFFSNNNNVLTVFIAWMNLDLGIVTCFYDGMDAYAHTWLQFAFPLYVWFLITLIIITSRYSILVTKLIGSNPIAVLATLLLMSYTKILKNIIGIYSFVELEYPSTKVNVWFKDATVPYLQSHHLLLAILTSIFIVLFLFPYTVILLLGYKIYRYSRKRYIYQIMIRLKPLLDSYYAPHEQNSRFWPGLLLLVRCALYIVFTFDYIYGSNNSLLAINIMFTILIVIAWLLSWLSVRIYTSFFVSTIEALVFLNLIVLTVTKLSGADSFELTFSLVGMVFAIMVGIIFYQFYFIYIAKSALWQKFIVFVHSRMRKVATTENVGERTPLINEPTRTVVDLREPVMDDN